MIGFYFFASAQDKIFDFLTPGKYQVGLKVVQTYDYSRTFGPKIIENGVMKNNARPMQILVWYPSTENGEKIAYKDYITLGLSEIDFTPISNEQKNRIIEMHKRNFLRRGADSASMTNVINRECFSAFNSTPAEGNFPLIIYSPGGNERCYENFILAEYLSSNGYIVASAALTGSETQLMNFELSDYELSVDDISFIISYMHNFPHVDNSKLGLIGFCYGSMINFMVANKNSNVDVLVDLFGANNIEKNRNEVEDYRYMNLKNPKMAYLQLAGSPEERDSYFFENYLYGDAYQARFDNVSHNAFTSNYITWNHYFNDILPGGHSLQYRDTAVACYTSICKLTLQMLNAYIKNENSALSFMNNDPQANGIKNVTYQKYKGTKLPPYPTEFIKIAQTEGVAKAKEIYNTVRSKDKSWKLFAENQMNILGYQFLGKNMIQDAIDIFSMILLDNPNSWNGYDSLAEAYLKSGDKEKAIANYKKSLELNPHNTNAVKMLEKIGNI